MKSSTSKFSAKIRVSVLLPQMIVSEVKQVSQQNSVTQSSIIEKALKFWLKEKIDQDTKELASLKFDDLPSENEWLTLQPKI